MQCVRCQFENLPGQTRCFKCGSILAGSGGAIAIEPPRMAAWKRPFRNMARSLRGCIPMRRSPFQSTSHPSQRGESFMAVESLGSLVLGLIPGLPYLLTGQFRSILLLWLAWLVLFCLGMFFYGLPEGWTLIGLAVAVHAWLIFRHKALEVLEKFGERIVVLLFLVLVLVAAYVWLPRLVIPGLGCIQSNMAIPYHHIENGDALLMRRVSKELKRGMLVGFWAHTYGVLRDELRRRGDVRGLGQIVGLPGERLEIRRDVFAVNSQALDAKQYPVPGWLHGQETTVPLGQGEYFVSCVYGVQARGRALNSQVIQRICVVDRERIESRAFMLWWPLSRRGWLEVD